MNDEPITITYKGFKALVERAALEQTQVKLLSLVGTREAVKAIWAALVTQGEVFLETPNAKIKLEVEKSLSRTQKLECGKTHLIMVDAEIVDSKIVIAETSEDFEDKLWAATQLHCPTPLHASWRDWVLREVSVEPLTTVGSLRAARVNVFEAFTTKVSNAVRWGILCA